MRSFVNSKCFEKTNSVKSSKSKACLYKYEASVKILVIYVFFFRCKVEKRRGRVR